MVCPLQSRDSFSFLVGDILKNVSLGSIPVKSPQPESVRGARHSPAS
jgi:hypothetical protein